MDKKIVEEFVQKELVRDRSGHDFMHVCSKYGFEISKSNFCM
jgi:hypothetical protein